MTLASTQEGIPHSLKARAYSSLAKALFDLALENSPKQMDITFLYKAGQSANEAIALGLISPATLMVASKIEATGFRRPEDNKFPEHSTERFEQLTDLWEALDARKAEMAEEKSKRDAKVSKDPLSYFCAAEDCGIVVTKKRTLRKCSGKCPLAFKPHYCSEDCQRVVRLPSHIPGNGTYFPCRIGNITNGSANWTLQNRALIKVMVPVRPLLSGDRIPRRTRATKGSNRAQSGPLT